METKISLEDVLHPRIVTNCLGRYLDGLFKDAAREAMTQVELAMKEKSGIRDKYGTHLANSLFGKGSGIKLRVPFGPEMQGRAQALFQAAFGYYRNYAAHDGAAIEEHNCFRIMVLATELLELIDASKKSLSYIGGVEGLVRSAVFATHEEVRDFLSFLDGYVVPGEAFDGFFEDLAERGYTEDQIEAVMETGLAEYTARDVPVPEPIRNGYGDATETIGVFELTPLGKDVLKNLRGKTK